VPLSELDWWLNKAWNLTWEFTRETATSVTKSDERGDKGLRQGDAWQLTKRGLVGRVSCAQVQSERQPFPPLHSFPTSREPAVDPQVATKGLA
jgi:hypothetical protein